jgi:hypothetical protein
MNHKWQAVENAAKILRLGDKATLGEIKRAYHRLSKENHPDLADRNTDKQQQEEKMRRIIKAYELLMCYCSEYRFPLKADKSNIYDANDWWLDRFGQDPLWGKTKK